jgi:hypothetical protein
MLCKNILLWVICLPLHTSSIDCNLLLDNEVKCAANYSNILTSSDTLKLMKLIFGRLKTLVIIYPMLYYFMLHVLNFV